MTRQEMIAGIESSVLRRIMQSGRMPTIARLYTRVELERILDYFDNNPDVTEAWHFYDGAIRSDAEYARLTNSRTAQLVSIATHGIPMPINRWSVEYCLAEPLPGVEAYCGVRRSTALHVSA